MAITKGAWACSHSPLATSYLSWSPDGSFIVASNAMNGPVFVAAVIERDDWLGQVSFVGHENTIQVAVSAQKPFHVVRRL